MSLKKIISTDLAPQAIGPYSQATASGNMVFISGQLGFDIATMQLPETFAQQAKNALYNVKAVVEAAESRLDHALQVTVFLKNMDNFSEFNEIYSQFFAAQPPARQVVEVSRLPKDALIEISLIGFVKDSM